MPLKNTAQQYGSIAKFFHWLIAILVICMLAVGISFDYIPPGETKTLLLQGHKSMGVTILILMVLRLLWRLTNIRPPLPMSVRPWQRTTAKWVQGLLYLTVIALPISGIIMTYAAGYQINLWWVYSLKLSWIPQNKTLASIAHEAHGIIAWTVCGLLILHTLGGLKHLLINKDGVFQKMWPSSKKSRSYFH